MNDTVNDELRSEIIAKYRHFSVLTPTVALFVLCIAAIAGVFYLCRSISPWFGVLNIPLLYYLFTPAHEAEHRMASSNRWVNELIGWIAGGIFIFPFTTHRIFHLRHHGNLNIEGKDADLWSIRKPTFFYFATQTMYYHYLFARNFSSYRLGRRIEWLLHNCALAALITTLLAIGETWILFGWILPAIVAAALLSYTLIWLPHLDYPRSDNQFTGTNVRSSRFLKVIFCFHNYHLIHHLYPSIPFYKYPRIWKEYEEYFRSKGAIVIE